ncbi:hypothetical protein Ae201684_003780 [Aphanomyces euteiches]|uniref:Uncharacterized protein n=1 Tax=Aphanomyces euteiches TaxID=100861 RepID=A0A6G0XKL5_9STRA|nr:hypothetical protein Ae201684_003780 [Aphanomyces euteiches]
MLALQRVLHGSLKSNVARRAAGSTFHVHVADIVRPRWNHTAPIIGGYTGTFSGKTGEWEPDRTHLEEVIRKDILMGDVEPTLHGLIRHDIDEARRLFRSVLQLHYHDDMGMWNKWGTMEWKDGKYSLARKIFAKASKIRFDSMLWQSWATMESELQNYIEARRLFKVILATEPADSIQTAMAGLGLALVEEKCGHTEKARRMLKQYHKRFPDDLPVAEAYALFEGRNGNIALARYLFAKEGQRTDTTPQFFHAWAYFEYNLGFYRSALEIVTKGLTYDPYDKSLNLLLALTFAKLEDYDAAREAFQRHMSFAVADPRAFNAFAQFEEEQGNYDTAAKIYEAYLKRDPTNISNITSLAYLQIKIDGKDGVESARQVFAAGAEYTNGIAPLIFNWGVFEEGYGSLDKARQLLLEATEKSPWAADYWCSLARTESRRGDIKAARVILDKATMQCDNKLSLLVALAKLELKNRNYKQAREACVNALKIDKKKASVWNLRALVELPHNPDKAKNIIESALKIIPTQDHNSWAILLCTYGRSHTLLGAYEDAAASFRESIRLDPTNYHSHMYLAGFMATIGEYKEAKDFYMSASRLCPRHKVPMIEKEVDKMSALIKS